jgi:hypothetical protein
VVLQADCGWIVALIAKARFVALDLREAEQVIVSFQPAAVCVI